MEYIRSSNRNQLEFYCLEETLDAEHPARFIEAFVDKRDLQALGLVPKPIQKEVRPAFDPKVFLKLYLYGYLNGIRSSRRLEKECARKCMRDPHVQWCERRTPLVYTDGAAYSISRCPSVYPKCSPAYFAVCLCGGKNKFVKKGRVDFWVAKKILS